LNREWLAGAAERARELAARWRASERLVAETVAIGFDDGTARRGLLAELDAWVAPGALEAVLEDEVAAMGERIAPHRVVVVAARTLPASAMRQILWARVLGAEVWLKAAQGQEGLAEALCEGGGGRVRSLGAGRGEALARALRDADAVAVLGSDETVEALRGAVAPGAAFVGYGHKVSGALVGSDEGLEGLAAMAQDCVAWDHTGCLSPRVVWVRGETGGVMAGLAGALGEASRGLLALRPEEAHGQRVAATRARMLGRPVASGGSFVLIGGERGPAAGRRVIHVATDGGGEAVLGFGEVLSTLGLGAGVEPPGGLPGSVRGCALGEMQRPGLDWRQDGLRPLVSLMRGPAATG
jgi:hypothetical protein